MIGMHEGAGHASCTVLHGNQAKVLRAGRLAVCRAGGWAHLWARPRVQAKMEATGLVLVGCPFWYCRQCRVTVPARTQRRLLG